jgi:hypothetical protein
VPIIVTEVPGRPEAGLTLMMCSEFTLNGNALLSRPFCRIRALPEAAPGATSATTWVSLQLCTTPLNDTVARLLPGVLGNEASSAFESFQDGGHGEGLLDCPHWTRPAEFRGWKAPEVLLGGNHEEIRKFRRQSAREKTARLRPDLLR